MHKNQRLTQSWRWYGPQDPVSLQDVRQAGATHVVTALHQVPHGEVWPVEAIKERKALIEAAGLRWDVVESLPVHESIKLNEPGAEVYLENYRQSLKNLSACGIRTICYNFMPVLDWTRTELYKEMEDGSKALYFDWVDLAVFDRYILKRAHAQTDYPEQVWASAARRYPEMTQKTKDALSENILMGIPGEGNISLEDLQRRITQYQSLGREGLKANLKSFLEAIAPVCEQKGVLMTIHPDDPPYPILGLPRIVSGIEDYRYLLKAVDARFNGICFCTGSLGAGKENNLLEIFELVKSRTYFVHLRNIRRDAEGNFFESDHLDGEVDMPAIMQALLKENALRREPIPFRPDHGHQMLDDLDKVTNPGYSAIGRLRGLAELRGLELGILHAFQ